MSKKPYRSLANVIDIDDPPKNYNKLVDKYIGIVMQLEVADRKITLRDSVIKELKSKMLDTEMEYCNALIEYEKELESIKNDTEN